MEIDFKVFNQSIKFSALRDKNDNIILLSLHLMTEFLCFLL